MGGFASRAIPPVRIRELCEALDLDAGGQARCCIESICDDDYGPAFDCLTGMIQSLIDSWR